MNTLSFLKQLTTKKLQETLVATFERMPLSVIFAVITFGIFVTQIALDGLPEYIENIIGKSILTLIAIFFFSIAVQLYNESSGMHKLRAWRNQLATVIFGVLFYTFFEEYLFSNFYTESFVYIAMTMVGTVAAVFIAPFIAHFLSERTKQREFYIFGYQIVLSILMAIVVGIMVMLLGFAAWLAITTLFDIGSGDMYAYWAAFSLVLFAPVFFLSQLPSVKVDTALRVEDDKFYGFLIKYIGLPAIIFYFVILYAYTLKVLINFSQWPHGEVAWMVIGFSFFGYGIYTASYIFAKEFKLASTFRRFFPYLVLPQVLMLFYAIGLRINQYDLTINRYLVVTFGIWLMLTSLYFVFSHKKYLGMIPLGMILFIIITSLGPWGVYQYPEARQYANLQSNLQEAGIVDIAGVVTPLAEYTDITPKLSGEIYGGISYLCDNHGCDALAPIFANELTKLMAEDIELFEQEKQESIERLQQMIASETHAGTIEIQRMRLENTKSREYRPMNSWSIVSQLTEDIKVRRYYQSDARDEYKRFTTGNNNQSVVSVTGYDYYVQLDYGPILERQGKFGDGQEPRVYSSVIDVDNEVLKVYKHNELVQSFSLADEFANVLTGNNDALTFELGNNTMRVRVVLSELSIKVTEGESADVPNSTDIEIMRITSPSEYASGYILVKEL